MSAGVQELRIADLGDRHRTTMHRHVFAHPDHEVGGVLVGQVDGRTGRPRVTGVIPALEAVGETASVTFTHEAWSVIHERQEQEFPNTQIIGWYHSHPTFGIFLSEPDQFIHRNYFSDRHQFAYVVDPIERSEGIFGWRDGEITEFEHVVGFSTTHLTGADGIAVMAGDEPTVEHAPRVLSRLPEAPPSNGKLTIGLDDLTDVDEPAAPRPADGAAVERGVVLATGAATAGAASSGPSTGVGTRVARPAPPRPMDPRAEAARQAARRRRAILAGAASVVLLGGVGIAVATGSGGEGGTVGGSKYTDTKAQGTAKTNAEKQSGAARDGQRNAIAAFIGANSTSVEAYKKAREPKPAPGGVAPGDPPTGGAGTGGAGTGGAGTGGAGTGGAGTGGAGTGGAGTGGAGTGGAGTGGGGPNNTGGSGFSGGGPN